MSFWDASALVPLLSQEATTARMQALADRDSQMVVWWATRIECASAVARLERSGRFDAKRTADAHARLAQLINIWHEIEPSEIIRDNAMRFVRVHPLRTADALQLAAAFVAAEGRPASLRLITLDERLADAARKEGFVLVEIAAG